LRYIRNANILKQITNQTPEQHTRDRIYSQLVSSEWGISKSAFVKALALFKKKFEMKKLTNSFLFILLIELLVSCNDVAKVNEKTIEDLEIEHMARKITDSIVKDSQFKANFDTVGLYNSPVKILKARLYNEEYSSFRDISLTFKNVSGKKIEGIRFKWYGLNVFGDPADMGTSFYEGFGTGFTDEVLYPNQTTTSSWDINSGNAKKIVLAWPYEVVFSDGKKWEIGK
jgi:hypothetical protein